MKPAADLSAAKSAFASDVFQFTIEGSEATFALHRELVAAASVVLKSDMSGGFTEAAAKHAHIEDVDEETFLRFSQYLYTGDYSSGVALKSGTCDAAPAQKKKSRKTQLSDAFDVEIRDEWSAREEDPLPAREKRKGSRKSRFDFVDEAEDTQEQQSGSARLWEGFKNLSWGYDDINFVPQRNASKQEDFTPVFLSHARLYVFANKYLVPDLEALTLCRLRKTLECFDLRVGQATDVVALARYAYEKTVDRQGVQDLRALVVHFVACHINSIGHVADFQDLMTEDGALGRDLTLLLMQRL